MSAPQAKPQALAYRDWGLALAGRRIGGVHDAVTHDAFYVAAAVDGELLIGGLGVDGTAGHQDRACANPALCAAGLAGWEV